MDYPPLIISHFHSCASLRANVVFPAPGFPKMMKQVGLE